MNRSVMDRIAAEAAKLQRHVVLPEPADPRVIEAARELSTSGLARITLLGTNGADGSAGALGNPAACEWLDPARHPRHAALAGKLLELRSGKGLGPEEADRLARDPLYCAGLMVAIGEADAVVAGSLATTADVIRAGLHTIGTPAGRKLVSSFFLMELPDGKVLSFADCAVVPQPDAGQLAEIAITTADHHRRLTGDEPRIAMLSFSTKGSARHPDVDKVVEATALVRAHRPDLMVDGELQFDAAFDLRIGQRKAPDSTVAGQANVFVFPDLDAGNIGYKIAQRIGGATAIGPLVQGLRHPFMDLSRGCSATDIVHVATIAAVMANSRTV